MPEKALAVDGINDADMRTRAAYINGNDGIRFHVCQSGIPFFEVLPGSLFTGPGVGKSYMTGLNIH